MHPALLSGILLIVMSINRSQHGIIKVKRILATIASPFVQGGANVPVPIIDVAI